LLRFGKRIRATYSYFPGADDESQNMRRCLMRHLLGVSLGRAALRALKRPQFSPASSVISPPAVSGASHSTSQPPSAQQLGHAATAAASQSAAAASYGAAPQAGLGAAKLGAGAAGIPLAAGDLPRELPVWRRLPERRGVVVAGALPRRRRLAAAETAQPPVAAPQAGLGAAKLGAGAAGVPLVAGDLLRELPVWWRLPERRGVVVAGALPRRRRLAAAASGGCC